MPLLALVCFILFCSSPQDDTRYCCSCFPHAAFFKFSMLKDSESSYAILETFVEGGDTRESSKENESFYVQLLQSKL